MPIKDGDKVFFKIQNGTVRTGKYDAKTKMVMLAGGKKAKPPKKALFHTRASAMKNAFMGATNPNPELGAAPRKKTTTSSKNNKEKPTPKKTAIDKKAQEGKLTQKAFLEDVVLQDGYDEANDDDYENRFESEMYLARDNMTEEQEQRFLDRASNRAYRDAEKFRKALFKKLIKGKKFKSFKEASKLFITNISKNHPDLDI